jgi:hypothetical protein
LIPAACGLAVLLRQAASGKNAGVLMSTISQEFFTPAADIDACRILAIWAWLLRKPFRLLGASAFGDLFLEDADGTVKKLDLSLGELKPIATCLAEFEWGLGDGEHQEEWLMVGLARRATQAGIRPASNKCIAFQTPPLLGGRMAPENLIEWDLYRYHEGVAKLLPQILNLPLGTEVRMKPGGSTGH